ncbi:transposase, partial [Shigella dysenteriae]
STLKSPSYTKSVSWQHYPTPERNKINFISPRRFRNKYENTERLCKFFVRP